MCKIISERTARQTFLPVTKITQQIRHQVFNGTAMTANAGVTSRRGHRSSFMTMRPVTEFRVVPERHLADFGVIIPIGSMVLLEKW
jgi:hypothetical protein